jgi:tetratricopeptide (TPR) repeat protein
LINKKITELVRRGELAEAIVAANEALNDHGEHGVLFYTRGMARLGLHKLVEAEADFSKAIECDDITPSLETDAFINRGAARKLLKQYEDAMKDYTEALKRISAEKKPRTDRSAVVVMNVAQLCDARREFDKAIESYTEYIALGDHVSAPLLALAHNNRGLDYLKKPEHREKALQDFDAAIALDAHNALYFFNRSLAHEAMGNIPLAGESCWPHERHNLFAVTDCTKAAHLDSTELVCCAVRCV